MGLFSFLRKNKQESTAGDSEFYSRAEEESAAVRGRTKRKSRKPSGDSADQVLPEKKRARRRLVGAAALVLAAVIGLPMILDSQPKPLADDISIQIPSREQAQLPSSSPVAARPRVAAADTLDPQEEVVTPPAKAMPAPALAVPAQPAETKLPEAAGKPAATRNDGKTAALAEPAPRTEPKATPDKAGDAARAAAILEGKADTKAINAKTAADGKAERIVLQVAALASKEKIDELQGKLKKAGIASHTQKVATESGERTRIRVGPFASKEEADRMRAKLAKLGLNGTAVSSSQ